MKKMCISLMVAVFIAMAGFASAADTGYLGRKSFAMNGEFIEYIPFSFEVPYGNCNNIRTFEYAQSYGGPADAYWEELVPGSQVVTYSVGIFKFIVDGAGCDPKFTVEGTLFDTDIYGVWGGMEQNPEDLGVLVKGFNSANNYFNLPVDDREFSYVIAFPLYGMKHELRELVEFAGSGNGGIQPAGSNLVGAITTSNRGYLTSMIFYPEDLALSAKKLRQAGGTVVHDDQIVVLIYKENYR